jgi:hypothetical protein
MVGVWVKEGRTPIDTIGLLMFFIVHTVYRNTKKESIKSPKNV